VLWADHVLSLAAKREAKVVALRPVAA
jgi:hypothetical protein